MSSEEHDDLELDTIFTVRYSASSLYGELLILVCEEYSEAADSRTNLCHVHARRRQDSEATVIQLERNQYQIGGIPSSMGPLSVS
jgi:hypothetical protein